MGNQQQGLVREEVALSTGTLAYKVSKAGAACTVHGIVLLSDEKGFATPYVRRVAHQLALRGYVVVCPDCFRGRPRNSNDEEGGGGGGAKASEGDSYDSWAAGHPVDRVVLDAEAAVVAMESWGVSACGVVGFGWGGMMAVQYAAAAAGRPALAAGPRAVVALYPVGVRPDMCTAVAVPTLVLFAGSDARTPFAQVTDLTGALAASKVGANPNPDAGPDPEPKPDPNSKYTTSSDWLRCSWCSCH